MARDENNGELPFSQRFFYASGRKAFKQAHASARLNEQYDSFWH